MSLALNFKAVGLKTLVKELKKKGKKTRALQRKLLIFAGTEVSGEAKVLISRGTRTGIVYPRGRKFHRASAEGEPPKTDRGFLVSSIKYKIINNNTVEVSANTSYADYLEFGTKNILPRPYLRPAIKNKKDAILAKVRKESGRFLKADLKNL